MMENNMAAKPNDMTELITETTPWLPISTVKSRGAYHPGVKMSGVYQISTEQVTELVHSEIGYVGMSKNVEDRVYGVKLGFYGKKSNHTAGKWLKSNGFDPDTTYYRILFCEEALKLERMLQETNKKEFGYTYKWQGAGGNQAGRDFQLQEMINELSITSIVEDVIPMVERKIGRELLIALLNKEVSIKAIDD
jgi:hypothetical protein